MKKKESFKSYRAFRRLALSGTRMNYHTIGNPETISSIKLKDLEKVRAAGFRPENAILSVFGDIREDEALRLAERYFSSEARRQKTVRNVLEFSESISDDLSRRTPGKKYENIISENHSGSSSLFMGGVYTDYSNDFEIKMRVLLEFLCGDSTSPLVKKLRDEKKYTYGIKFTQFDSASFGLYYLSLDLDEKNIQDSIDIIKTEIANVASSDPENLSDNLSKTIRRMKFNDLRANQDLSTQAIKEVSHLIYKNMGSSTPEDRLERTELITPEDLKLVARWAEINLDTVIVFSRNPVSVNV